MTSYALTHSKSKAVLLEGPSPTGVITRHLHRAIHADTQNNQKAKKSSPVTSAKDLHGKLLLIHGAIDDNVHMANTVSLFMNFRRQGSSFS